MWKIWVEVLENLGFVGYCRASCRWVVLDAGLLRIILLGNHGTTFGRWIVGLKCDFADSALAVVT